MLNPKSGMSVAEFQVSGIPWTTSSVANGVVRHQFGDVTLSGSAGQMVYLSKWIRVANITTGSSNIQVAFTQRGLNTSNYFTLKPNTVFQGDLRISELWISGTDVPYEITAGLTTIECQRSYTVTGSLGVPGVG